MAVSSQYLANLLPFAAQQGVLPGYSGGTLPGYGTFNAGAPGNIPPPPPPPDLVPAGPPLPPPMAPAAPEAPALVPAPEPLAAQAAPPTALIATRTPGSAAREVSTVGPQQTALIEDATKKRVEALVEQQQLGVQQQQEAIKHYQDANVREEARLAGAQAAQANEQVELSRRSQAIDDAVSKRSVEPPTSYWADKSTGAKIGMALAAAIGSFGAALTNGKNPAMELLNADMQRDLNTKELRFRQQTGEANARVDAAQANFNNMARQVGIHAARDIEAASQQNIVANQAKILAAKTGIPDLIGKTDGMIAELGAKAAEFKAQAMLKYQPATAGGVTYTDPKIGIEMTRTEALKHRQGQEERKETQAGKVDLQNLENEGKLASSRATTKVDAVTKGTQFIASHLGTAKIPQAMKSYQHALKLNDAYEKSGGSGIGAVANGIYASGAAARKGYKTAFGQKALEAQQAWGLAEGDMVSAMSGAGVPQQEMDTRWAPAFRGAGDPADRRAVLMAAQARLQQQVDTIMAGAGPEAAEQFKANMSGIQGDQGTNSSTGIPERAAR